MKDIFGKIIDSPMERTIKILDRTKGVDLYQSFISEDDEINLIQLLEGYEFPLMSHTFKRIPEPLDILRDKIGVDFETLSVVRIESGHGYRNFKDRYVYENTIILVIGSYQVWEMDGDDLYFPNRSVVVIDTDETEVMRKIKPDVEYSFNGIHYRKDYSWVLTFRKFK